MMEGVLVNIKREGSTVTTTVVTNEKGRYSFPADRIEPGKYTITIRAVGYILDGPKSVEIPAGGNATADLKLNRARNIQLQLSNAEWMQSLPGTDREKQFLTGCTGCHTLAAPVHRAARCRRVGPGVQPDGHLLSGLDAGAAATARQRRRPQRAPARRSQDRAGGGAVPGRRQPHQSGGQGIRVQAESASQGPRHPRDHHRIRPAAEERLSA